jgi:hypothetical protein
MPSKPKTSRRETTYDERRDVWDWYLSGYSYSEIGRLSRLPKSTVGDIITRVKATAGTDRFINKRRTGKPPKLTVKAERRLLRAVANNTRANLAALGTPSKSGKKLSCTTVRKTLKRYGKARRRACKKPYLSTKYKRRRVVFGKENSKRKWRFVIWSDESTFKIRYDGRNWWITRVPGEEHLPKNLKLTFKSGRTSVGVWGCFMWKHLGPLVILLKGSWMN